MPLAGMKHENGFGPGGTTSCILGFVSNKLCLINSNIGTKKGGAVDYATSLKNLRIGQIAEENKLTLINLVESGVPTFLIKIKYLPIMVKCFMICQEDQKKAS